MKEEGEKGDEKVPIFMVVVAGNSNYWFPVLTSHIINLKHLLMYFFLGGGGGVWVFFGFLNIYSSRNSGPIFLEILMGCLDRKVFNLVWKFEFFKGNSPGKSWVPKLNFTNINICYMTYLWTRIFSELMLKYHVLLWN